jgi:hypothetical protein
MTRSDRSWSRLSGRNLPRQRLPRLRSSNKHIPILTNHHRVKTPELCSSRCRGRLSLHFKNMELYYLHRISRAPRAGGACLTTTAIYIDYTFYDFRMMHATLYLIAFYFSHSVYISFICSIFFVFAVIYAAFHPPFLMIDPSQ